jgi:dinuclear metal center YbgI/SA1388 family protein
VTAVADLVAVLEELYPPGAAEPWDRVGLTVGSKTAPVTTILYTVDCTAAVVAEAVSVGADLIVAHHPLLLRGVHAVTDDHPKGRIVTELIRGGIALYVAHTNADKPVGGVVAALADAFGLSGTQPLVPEPSPSLDLMVTFVPDAQAAAVTDALADAGAGEVGNYDRCSFRSTGQGAFRPRPGADPYLGQVGELEEVAETRIEMVLSRDRRSQVVQALLAAHPYETPAFHLVELAPAAPDDAGGLGRLGRLADPISLRDFAELVQRALPPTAGGIRVSGDLDRRIELVAVQAGAGDELLDIARSSRADVYVTSDLRHHPASEAREWPDGPALIDIPHWAAESTWLPVVRGLVDDQLLAAGTPVPSVISTVVTDPWNYAL